MWNLVDPFSDPKDPDQRRAFYLPLASKPPGVTSIPPVTFDAFQPQDLPQVAGSGANKTSDLPFSITIPAPAGGFADDGDLPDPRIRLHATQSGQLTFVPAKGGQPASLKLTIFLFATPDITDASSGAFWFERWREANCIPSQLLYDNVDATQLSDVLDALPAPDKADPAAPPTSKFGVSFPLGVTAAGKQQFITDFMNGADGHELLVVPGAYIGTAGPKDPAAPDGDRQLVLRAGYASGDPLSTREYFHLLFGNDSIEATTHPLLVSIDTAGRAQTVQPETKRMLLRPPLRTHARVIWEADQEIANHPDAWASDKSITNKGLGPDRFFASGPDAITFRGRQFTLAQFTKDYKCNLFVCEIALRAGFHVPVGETGTNGYHYLDANSISNLAHALQSDADTTERQKIVTSINEQDIGATGNKRRTWGYRLVNLIRAQADADRQKFLNDLMNVEGRCIIFAGSRPRKFRNYTFKDSNGHDVTGIASCATAIGRGIGHIVLIEEFTAKPIVKPINQTSHVAGDPKTTAIAQLTITTREAQGVGARKRTGTFAYNAEAPETKADALANFIWLEPIELVPGGDPQSHQGLRDLFVVSGFKNSVGLAIETAPHGKKIDLNPDGTKYTGPTKCCHDLWPTTDSADDSGTDCGP